MLKHSCSAAHAAVLTCVQMARGEQASLAAPSLGRALPPGPFPAAGQAGPVYPGGA